jgi:osmoprotectant transport system substrate-binding protein/osmoprotectant transport system permease protein
VSEQLALLPGYLAAHLRLTLVALGAGAALAVPIGVAVTRRPRLAPAVLAAAGVVQTIPSLALLAFMVPALALLGAWAGLEIRSIGYLPAVLALTLYSVLPILQNTVVGIRGVDPTLLEAARGVGMTPRQQLLHVELPMALPVMVAGLRTATVWVVGTATLSTPVGATSLGNYIFSGLQTRNFDAVWIGCVSAAALAVFLDQVIRLLESGVRGRHRGRIAAAAGLIAALVALTGASAFWSRAGEGPRAVTIGSKTFTEQYILSDLLASWIERRTGLPARAVQSLGSTVLFDALVSGEIDVYVDYSGTLWASILKRRGPPAGRAAVLEDVRESLRDEYGVVVAAALGFENTYALAMRADRARALGVTTFSDLARVAPGLEIGADYEFFARPEWPALRGAYGFAFREARSMDPSLMYQALAAGEVDVITAFSTDGRIAAFDLVVLEDDRGVIPPYDALVLVGPRLAHERPDVVAALGELEGTLDAATLRRLNLAVDEGGRSPAEVGRELAEELAARRATSASR